MVNGFTPRVRAKRLLQQSAGLMPPSDVRPATGLAPAVEAALNLQLAEGLITQEQFQNAVFGQPTAGDPRFTRPTPEQAKAIRGKLRERRGGEAPGLKVSGAGGMAQELKRRRRAVRAARRKAHAASLGPLGPFRATPGRLPSFEDLLRSF